MLDLVDYLIIVLVLLLSILIGFIPKLAKFLNDCKCCDKKKHALNDDDNERDLYTPSFKISYEEGEENVQVYKAKSLIDYNDIANVSSNKKENKTEPEKAKTKTNFFANAISLVIGFQTSISIVGLPVEFYYYGFKSWQINLCLVLAPFLIAKFFIPFIYKIKSDSLYEYLDDKFDGFQTVKNFTVLLVILFQFIFASCVLYSASVTIHQILSLNHSIDLWPICAFVGVFSVLMALFGLRSVVLANFVQYLIMIGCMLTFIILGVLNYDQDLAQTSSSFTSIFNSGLKSLWNVTKSTDRHKLFVFQDNFRTRYTFWNCLIGMMFNTIPTYCLTQQSFMRIKQCKSIKSAKMLVLSIIPFGVLNMTLTIVLGFVMFGYFYKCGDPLSLNTIKNQNQLLSKFLTQFYDKYTGLAGLYIALLLSSSIGTLSSVLTALSITISNDVFRGIFLKRAQRLNNNANVDRTIQKENSFMVQRRLSDEQNELIYLEEFLPFKINFKLKRKKRKLFEKYTSNKHKPKTNKKLIVGIILTSGLFLIVISSLLELIKSSMISIAFSLLNAIHGPVLFIYMCARFNEYSIKRHKYALNRSMKSKLRNFKFNHVEIILSCVFSMLFVEFLYFGQLNTSGTAKQFYDSEKLQVSTAISPSENLSKFCRYEANSSNLTIHIYEVNENVYKSQGGLNLNHTNIPSITNLNYLFAISFNWYPFISFFSCTLLILFFIFTRVLIKFLLCLFFKK